MIAENGARVRVLLVDDHQLVRAGLRMLIDNDPGCVVVGEAGDRRQALDAAARTDPQMILLDLDLGGERATDFLADLQASAPRARVLVLTGLQDSELHQKAIRLGARGVLLKSQAAASLLKAIRKVHDGELWLDRAVTAALVESLARGDRSKVDDPAQRKIETLTPREREVVALVAAGHKNQEIAERLFISETTVRHHLTAIFAKLEAPDRLGLVLFAFRHGLAAPPK